MVQKKRFRIKPNLFYIKQSVKSAIICKTSPIPIMLKGFLKNDIIKYTAIA